MIANVVRNCFPVAAQVVADKADEINKLNVFPVPDGDTGTNMSLTLGTVVKEIEALPQGASMDDIAKAITHGSLMGARGNSGVITSQILRGVAEGLASSKGAQATTADIASALRNGVKVAFKAVRKPVEGTILTVLRDVSTKADQMERAKATPQETLDAIVVEAYESVARTPDLLPVLRENGVVDSGAFGLATFIEAFVNAYNGKAGEVSDFRTTVDSEGAKAQVAGVVDIEINEDWEGSEFRYCTEFLFHADSPDFDESANLKYLSSMGDCELLVGSNPDYKIHVHTNRPDRVLRHMLHRGQIFNVFVHNMDLEAQERTESIREDKQAASGPRKPLGFVAVAAGSGQADILRSLGVDVIVSGGQTMNPSTADILGAIKECNAEGVIVLPNNGNIRMAAEAAVSACEGVRAAVVPTKTVLQAFAAMFAADPEGELDANVDEMSDAIAQIRDGEITTAVRDSAAADGTPIHSGDVMGIEGGSIEVVGSDVEQVTIEVINRMQAEEEGDTLTILAGSDLDDDAFQHLLSAIEEAQPDLEVDAHRGEQPLYPVVFSIE
ncbi:DAK2 domain fusion protein YloV [Olsenella uli DSM 7084]|uniref:DAK2 domain fusion protein YloV n=1 Tax=Olsenella uli (strain ATCC 49627 / DSM 7084 / CCUG 31166 / CIP 109912 / JCM 12494 / LMG 11480 / NCIMB 702895 / VPI D76D-27C) TaxID=633147 RepID=E1QVM2_OLSUV|nr:DAK2 domain-containing protein [Olsenella uli]ADK68175.1 DAK2 domain fusion protein YloV [Olsenella uli DSM 7084]KRO13026.1 DAK2 domain fusion protein YloV [Olsenella uli DSM 7084]